MRPLHVLPSTLLVLLALAITPAMTSIFTHGTTSVAPRVVTAAQSNAQPAPVIVGWGGTRLDETVSHDPSNPPSNVFPGEQASNQEMQVLKLQSMGLNAFRVSFQSACGSPQEMGSYDSSDLERSIAIAEHYGFWVIVDYHGYNDLAINGGPDCWLNFWRPVVQQFQGRYERIVWEPLNEPNGFGDNVPFLGEQYQRWINQTRSLGDTHWIVVQSVCSYGCGLSDWADGFPSVADPVGKVFISLHSYMGYHDYPSSWNNSTAEAVAQRNYQAVLDGIARTGWPVLNTEGGADELCDHCAPDEVLTGSAGYTVTSFHFIQALTNLYDSYTPRINWVWWTMGSWTDTPGAGLYGSLAPNGWGSLLQYRKTVQSSSTLNASFSYTPTSPTAGQLVNFQGSASGTAPYSYTWQFGDAASATGQSATHAYSRAGTYTASLTVTDANARSGSTSNTITVAPLPSPDFTITANPDTLFIPPGSSDTSTIQLTSINGFSATISLTVLLSPQGPSGSLNPASVPLPTDGTASSVLTLTTSSQTPEGQYDAAVTANSGSVSHTVHVSLTVSPNPPPPDFAISASPSSLTIHAGTSGTSMITFTSVNGYAGTISVSAPSASGLTVSFDQSSIAVSAGGSSTVTMTVAVSANTSPGSFSASVDATDGQLSHSTRVSVSVAPGSAGNNAPSLSVPGPQTGTPGSAITFTISASDPDGDAKTLAASGLPQGASFDPSTGVFSWLPGLSQVGNYTVTFTATDNGSPPLSDTRSVDIQVRESATPPPSQPPSSQGSCSWCQYLSPTQNNVWLLLVGGLFGLTLTLTVLYARTRSHLNRANRTR